MSSDAEAREAGPCFDFTRAQWQTILSAVHDGCSQPPRFRADWLLRGARAYLANLVRHTPPSARAAAWKRVARLLGQTRDAILNVDRSGRLDRGGASISAEELEWWQGVATEKASWELIADHPRTDFFGEVLSIWMEAGGRLRFSRGAPETRKAGQLGGPTMRYFQTVTGAVMGDAAPTPEGLRKILERYARQFENVLFEDECLVDMHRDLARSGDAAAHVILGAFGPGKKRRHIKRVEARWLVRGRGRARR